MAASNTNARFTAEDRQPLNNADDEEPVCEEAPRRWGKGVAVLAVYCVHNAWNCWMFENMSADLPAAEQLFSADEAQLGILNTLGTAGIFALLPVAMMCRWRRAVLALGAVLNLGSVVLRYAAALRQSYGLAAISMFGTGAAYGILAVWPPILAAGFFKEARWSVVIALAGLSNYAGGALGALFTPVLAGGVGTGLLRMFEGQVYAAAVLSILTGVWLWIPDLQPEGSQVSLKEEALACARPRVSTQVVSYGVMIGCSLALQCVNPPMLQGVGFSTMDAGVGNCIYQVAAAAVGVGVGGFVTERGHLRAVLWALHALALASTAGVCLLCFVVSSRGRSSLAYGSMLTLEVLQGASLMGLLPFVTQQVVYAAHPATENFVTGFLNMVAMLLAMGLNFAGPSMPSLECASVFLAIVALEVAAFVMLEGWWQAPDLPQAPCTDA